MEEARLGVVISVAIWQLQSQQHAQATHVSVLITQAGQHDEWGEEANPLHAAVPAQRNQVRPLRTLPPDVFAPWAMLDIRSGGNE